MPGNPFDRPGLDERRLKADLYEAFKKRDAEMASDLGLPEGEVETPQKSRERNKMAGALAEVLYKHLTEYARVVLPKHAKGTPSALPATDVAAGPGAHVHMITVPTQHDIGKLE